MRRHGFGFALAALVTLVLAGCTTGGSGAAATSSPTPGSPAFNDGLLTYDRVEQPGGGYVSMLALFVGTLAFENGCLLVDGSPYLFPHGITTWDGTTLTVGDLEYSVGDKIAAGGGVLHDRVLPKEIRDRCGDSPPVLVGSVQEEIPEPIGPPDLPTDEAWGKLPKSPLSARRDSVGAWVGDRVVIVGGRSDQPCQDTSDCVDAEPAQRDGASYDPYTEEWARIAPAPIPVTQYSSAVLNGNLYLFAFDVANGVQVGAHGRAPVSFLRYNVETDAWTTLPAPSSAGALVAAGDRLLAIPGSDENGATVDSIFDPATETWSALPDDPLGPSYDREGVWLHGTLKLSAKSLTSADTDSPARVRMATLDRALSSWFPQPDSDIIGIGALSAGDRVVFPFYGTEDGGDVNPWDRPYPNGGIFDPSNNSWKDLPELPELPAGTEFNEYADGRPPQVVGYEVLIGGRFLLDPMALTFTELPAPPWDDRTEATVITGPDSILVWGGVTYDAEDGSVANRADGYLLGL
jgi:hypothetical protein